jgi:hypothetical protein
MSDAEFNNERTDAAKVYDALLRLLDLLADQIVERLYRTDTRSTASEGERTSRVDGENDSRGS